MDILTLLRMLLNAQALQNHERWPREQLAAHRQHKLAELRAFAYRHSPFYRAFHAGLAERPLEELPVLTKQMVMDNFGALVTGDRVRLAHLRDGGDPDDVPYHVIATSGTTGEPGLFLFNDREWAWVLASFLRGQQLAGLELGLFKRLRVATIASSSERHLSRKVNDSMQTPWSAALGLPATTPVETLVGRLNDHQPDILIGYASMIAILAGEQRDGRLRISPAFIFNSGEVLTGEMREQIELAWGKRMFDQYGATETGIIAAQCAQQNGLHIYEDLLIVENVDEANRPVPPGELGHKLLVTVLFHHSQPLIRYELSDNVIIAPEPCPCGRVLRCLEAVEGREDEILTFATPDGRGRSLHPNLFHRVMDTADVERWQIVQRPDGLHLLLGGAADPARDEALQRALAETLRAHSVEPPPIHVTHEEELPRAPGGKRALIRSELDETTGAAP